jgi:putative oxidoreductase
MTNESSRRSLRFGLFGARMMMGVVFLVYGFRMLQAGLLDARRILAMYGFPDSSLVAVLVTSVACGGGIALLGGLFVRWGALLMATFYGMMAFLALRGYGWYGAILHVPRVGGFLPVAPLEHWLALVAVSLCLVVGGPGAFSLQERIRKNSERDGRRQAWAIGALRIIVGSIFVFHGWQKWAGYGPASVAAEFAKMHFPAPWLSGVAVTTVELVFGLVLISGMFARWAASVLATEMAVAVLAVHLGQGFLLGFFWPGGYEYALTLLVVNASLAVAGPGPFALRPFGTGAQTVASGHDGQIHD